MIKKASAIEKSHPTLAVFGGSFDPIHLGHLHSLWELTMNLPLDSIHFMPCAHSPHKLEPQTSAEHRLNMLKLATANQPHWKVDEREIARGGVSYTIDTLQSLHTEFPDHHLCLIIGSDVAAHLPQWKRWQELLRYAHLIVMTRPEYKLPDIPWILELQRRTLTDPELLRTQNAGGVWWQSTTPLGICATQIRKLCSNHTPPPFLVPTAVWDYMQKHQLYMVEK